MNMAELIEMIRNGENSGVEFKRDDVANHCIAKELVALLNLEGGTVLLGVEDDGTITGTTRENLEEWVAELCRVKVDPPIIPFLFWVKNAEPGRDVLAVRVPIGPDKPYALAHNASKDLFHPHRQHFTRGEPGRNPTDVSGVGQLALRRESRAGCRIRRFRLSPI